MSVLKDSIEIYFIFSEFYHIFYVFLKFIRFSRIINENEKNEKPGPTVLGRTMAHDFALSARPSRGYGPCHGDGRTHGAVTVSGARWPTARWCSADDEVLSASTGAVSGEAAGKISWIGAYPRA
jgi:hypothetical protein